MDMLLSVSSCEPAPIPQFCPHADGHWDICGKATSLKTSRYSFCEMLHFIRAAFGVHSRIPLEIKIKLTILTFVKSTPILFIIHWNWAFDYSNVLAPLTFSKILKKKSRYSTFYQVLIPLNYTLRA